MARDKQLVVRVTEETRAAFQDFCEREGQKASTLLADIIERLCQGTLSLDVALGQPLSSDLIQEQIATLVEQEVERAAAALVASPNLSKKINAAIAERLAMLEQAARPATSGRENPSVPPKVRAKSALALEQQIDLSTYDPCVGFTGKQLANAAGLQNASSVNDAIRDGRFAAWSQSKDPDGRAWFFTGDRRARRFFREEEQE